MTVNLSQSALDGQKVWAYVDAKQNIHYEENHFFNGLVRAFSTFMGWRDYDLAHVLPVLQKTNQTENVNFVFEKLAKQSGLSSSDLEALKSLSNGEPSEGAKSFIEKAIGNSKLNHAIRVLATELKDDTLIDRKLLSAVSTFSHKTRPIEALDRALEKVKIIQPMLRRQGMAGTLSPEHKLSHRDLIVMEDMAKLVPILQTFKRMGLYTSKKTELGALANKIHRVSNFINQVHNIAERQAPHSKSGNLIFYDVDNFSAKRGCLGKLFDTIVFKYLFKTPIFHASVGYSKKGKDIEADIWATFRQGRRSLYSRTFKTMDFNFDKLAGNEETRKKLETLYGYNWRQALHTKFGRLINAYFADTKPYEHLHNPASRRFLVGLGLRWNPFKNDLQKRVQFHQKESVCSEFATKSLMQCFTQLQEEVKADWTKSKRISNDDTAPELTHPIRDYRRLHRVTPHDMTRRLIDTGFATEAKHPQIIKDIIEFHDYDLQKS